jgi:hypothetical protein
MLLMINGLNEKLPSRGKNRIIDSKRVIEMARRQNGKKFSSEYVIDN